MSDDADDPGVGDAEADDGETGGDDTEAAAGGDAATDAALSVGDGWTETAHETGSYGPGDREGRAATFENGSITVRTVPVRYERAGNRETVEELAGDDPQQYERGGPVSVADDVSPCTAFATVVTYRPGERRRRDVFCVAEDPDDALAAGVWLTRTTDTDWEMERNLRLHHGQRTAAADVAVSDDDALAALFRAAPDRCVVTHRPTRSHTLTLPYRYVPALAGSKRTPRGVPRVPTAVRGLAGAVSHRAWEEEGFEDLDTAASVERVASGDYRLAPDVVDAVAGLDAANFSLRRLGEENGE